MVARVVFGSNVMLDTIGAFKRDLQEPISRYDAIALEREPRQSLRTMSYDEKQRRSALQSFIDQHDLRVAPWARAAGLGESTVRDFLSGRNRTLTDETYEKLAAAATEKIGRTVSASELRGDPVVTRMIAIAGYVGAGGEIVFDDAYAKGAGLDEVEAPPGETRSVVAVAIRGESQLPFYREGDVVFYTREPPISPAELVNEQCIVRLAEPDGRTLLKFIKRGTHAKRFTLASFNAEDIPDVAIEWAAPVLWIKRRPRAPSIIRPAATAKRKVR